MISLFLLLSCSKTERADLPRQRQETELVSHKIQYGDLKGHLYKRGNNPTKGFIVLSPQKSDCIADVLKDSEAALAINNAIDTESAVSYLSGQVKGDIEIKKVESFCKDNP